MHYRHVQFFLKSNVELREKPCLKVLIFLLKITTLNLKSRFQSKKCARNFSSKGYALIFVASNVGFSKSLFVHKFFDVFESMLFNIRLRTQSKKNAVTVYPAEAKLRIWKEKKIIKRRCNLAANACSRSLR